MLRVVVAVNDDLSKGIVDMRVMAALTDQMLQEGVQQLQPASRGCDSLVAWVTCGTPNLHGVTVHAIGVDDCTS